MKLHQLELAFDPVQDRLLFKIYTDDFTEYRLWLTRRFVKVMWDALVKVLAGTKVTKEEKKEKSQQVSKQFSKEQEQKNPATAKYATKVTKTPLGGEPMLISRLVIKPLDSGSHVLGLQNDQKEGFEIVADRYILLSICKLLSETAAKTDWDLEFPYPPS